MKEVVIVSAARTAFDKFGGLMKDMNTAELGSIVTKEVLTRANVSPKDIEEFYLGINMPTQNRSIARQTALLAGLPEQTNALTVDRACCSSLSAIAMAYRAIALGEAKVAIAGGSENMSNVPYFVNDLRWGKRIGDVVLKDIMVVSCPYTGVSRAVQAGNGADKYGVTRQEQDEWAMNSHKKYFEAKKADKFKVEIVPITIKNKKGDIIIEDDQSPRKDVSLESLAKLSTVYNSSTVTAGNAPGLNTGAAVVLLMSREEATQRGLKPLATIVSHAQVSDHPDGITYTPGFAAKKALAKVGMSIEQMDLIEINEAFAAMPLVSSLVLADNDKEKAKELHKKINVDGGAIAIGHPTGASAARLVMHLCYELQRRGGGYGLATICGGIGEGESLIVKV